MVLLFACLFLCVFSFSPPRNVLDLYMGTGSPFPPLWGRFHPLTSVERVPDFLPVSAPVRLLPRPCFSPVLPGRSKPCSGGAFPSFTLLFVQLRPPADPSPHVWLPALKDDPEGECPPRLRDRVCAFPSGPFSFPILL